MSDHLGRVAAIVRGCCAHCDDLVDERLALLDEAGLLRRPDDPEVHVEVTTQGSTCIVKVAGQVVFNGVGLEHALLTPSGVKRDAAVAALPLPVDGCACTPHEQSAGGVYTEYLLEYEPACPEHSEHLWDPTQGAWVLRSERDAAVAAKALREAEGDYSHLYQTRGPAATAVAAVTCAALRDRADRIEDALLNPNEGEN